jgi:hypothetical protein
MIPRALLFGCAMAVAACSGEPPHAPPPVTVIPVAPASVRADGPAIADSAQQAAGEHGPLSSATPAATLGRRFERVALPAGAGEIVAVAGRDDRDVWMMARGSDVQRVWVKGGAGGEEAKEIALPIDSVVHWDGARATARPGPRCFLAWEYKQTARTRLVSSRARPLSCNALGCDYAVPFDRILLPPAGVVLVGTWHHGQTPFPFDLRSRAGRDGRWSCEIEGQTPAAERLVGAAALRLDRNAYSFASLTVDGREIGVPQELKDAAPSAVAARSVDDLWLWKSDDEHVWHGTTHAWEARPAPVHVVALEIVEPGSAWVVGVDKDADIVLRWDAGKAAWTRWPTPAKFRATSILATSAHDVWFLGPKAFHHWDGRELRRIEAPPLAVHAAWLSASGELWVVGADPTVKIHAGTEEEDSAGAAFRLPVEPRATP